MVLGKGVACVMPHKTTKSLHSMLNAVMEVGVCLFGAGEGCRVWGMLGKGSVTELQPSKMPVCKQCILASV